MDKVYDIAEMMDKLKARAMECPNTAQALVHFVRASDLGYKAFHQPARWDHEPTKAERKQEKKQIKQSRKAHKKLKREIKAMKSILLTPFPVPCEIETS